MNTSYEVVWSAKARQGVDAIVTYIESRWTQKEVRQFLSDLQDQVAFISQHPKLFTLIEGTEFVRSCVLTKQTTIYYEFKNDRVEILYVFDTRQNPDKLRF